MSESATTNAPQEHSSSTPKVELAPSIEIIKLETVEPSKKVNPVTPTEIKKEEKEEVMKPEEVRKPFVIQVPTNDKKRKTNPTNKGRREHYERNKKRYQSDEEDTTGAAGETTKSGAGETTNVENSDGTQREKRLPKKKVAVLLGYCGSAYQGMQINPKAKTIEGEVIRALAEVGAISKDNASDPKKVQLSRAARTDKGVHAAGQVISLKLILDIEDLLKKVNESLPEDIRIYGISRTPNSFGAKTHCDSRIYEYLLPSYALSDLTIASRNDPPIVRSNGTGTIPPSTSTSTSTNTTTATSEATADVSSTTEATAEAPAPSTTTVTWEEYVYAVTPEEAAAHAAFRISDEAFGRLRDCFRKYKGTHNYHNYAPKQNFSQANSKRVIKSFEASTPQVIDGMEWISVKIHGQSFMMNQIRKMIGMAVLAVRHKVPAHIIDATFQNVKINIPRVPGFGLLLEQPVFDSFNRKQDYATDGKKITFEEFTSEMDVFKAKHIYDKINHEERTHSHYAKWLASVEQYLDGQYSYINSEGIIPPSAHLVEEGGTSKRSSDVSGSRRAVESDNEDAEGCDD